MKKLLLAFLMTFTFFTFNVMSQTNQTQWDYGTELTIRAKANPGWYFTNWSENGNIVSTDTVYVFTVTTNRNLIANFLPIMLNVEITTQQPLGGTFTGAGEYQWGSNVTLNAIPNEGWLFTNWIINGETVTELPHNFVITEETTVVCVFSKIVYSVILSAQPQEGGIVTGEGVYNYGDNVMINGQNNEGWTFKKWVNENGDSITENPHTFTIYEDKYFVGLFNVFVEIPKYNEDITIYPNPSNGKFAIKSENIKGIKIYDIKGVEVYEQSNLEKDLLNIDVTTLPTGVYVVKIYFENNVMVDSKIIIK